MRQIRAFALFIFGIVLSAATSLQAVHFKKLLLSGCFAWLALFVPGGAAVDPGRAAAQGLLECRHGVVTSFDDQGRAMLESYGVNLDTFEGCEHLQDDLTQEDSPLAIQHARYRVNLRASREAVEGVQGRQLAFALLRACPGLSKEEVKRTCQRHNYGEGGRQSSYNCQVETKARSKGLSQEDGRLLAEYGFATKKDQGWGYEYNDDRLAQVRVSLGAISRGQGDQTDVMAPYAHAMIAAVQDDPNAESLTRTCTGRGVLERLFS